MMKMLDCLWPWKRSEPASSNSPRSGLEVLYEGVGTNVDIVAIHGLCGDPFTWTAANGTMWLQHLLPSAVPNSRIMTYGYDAHIPNSRNIYRNPINSHANNLISALSSLRAKTESTQRPLIFVGHSLGGLVIKSALLRSAFAENDEENIQAIKSMTLGILFLGTPHQESINDSLADIVQNIAFLNRRTECKESESRCLESQLDQFKSISPKFLIFCCYETLSNTSTKSIIVPKSSATIRGLSQENSDSIALNKDHNDLCRFPSSDDADFKIIVELFRRFEERRIQETVSESKGESEVPKPGRVFMKDDFKIPFALDGRRQNPTFTGRKMALEQLHDYITVSNRISRISPVILIQGLGGMGKTQLALEYAYRNRYRFHSIFWINAHNIRSIQTSFLKIAQSIVRHYASRHDDQDLPYAEIARHLGLEDIVNENGDIETDGFPASLFINAVKEWLGRNGNTDWLLIFDDSDGLEYAELSTFFPDTLVGHIIVTRRFRPTARSFQNINLSAMNEQEAFKLFLNSCGRSESEIDHDAGVRIVQTLGYLPLAISQAASYISKVGVSFCEYLRLADREMEKQRDGDRSSSAALQIYTGSVRDTWEMSLGKLRTHDPAAANLLHLCSYFACENIPVEMVSLGLAQDLQSHQRLADCISTLRSFEFVTSAQKAESFSVHYLIHKWLRERQPSLSQAMVLEQAMKVIATAALAFKQPQSHLWVFEREIVPHITACLHWKDPIFWHEAQLVESHHWRALATICEHEGKYDDAEQLFKLANNKIASMSNPGLSQARLQLEIGTLCMRQRQFDKARDLFEAALSTTACESKDGGGEGSENASQLKLRLLLNFAFVFGEGLCPTEAEPRLRHALKESEELYGLIHPQTVKIVDILAKEYQKHFQYEKSEMTWRRELLSLKERLGSESAIVINKLCALANVCQLQGRYGEAERLFRRALASYERRLGVDHPNSLNMVSNLATLSDLQGNFQESRRLYDRVLVGRRGTLGPQHSKTLNILENQALSHRLQGEYGEAEQLYKRVLRGREKNMDSQADIQRTTWKLADLYMEKPREARALVTLSDAYVKRKRWFKFPRSQGNQAEVILGDKILGDGPDLYFGASDVVDEDADDDGEKGSNGKGHSGSLPFTIC